SRGVPPAHADAQSQVGNGVLAGSSVPRAGATLSGVHAPASARWRGVSILTMKHLRIGVRLESLALPLRRGLQEVERLGVTGVQVDAVGDLSPKTLSQTGRREFRHLLRAHNLELTALACPLRHGLDTADGQEARIEHIQQVLSQSFDLGPRIVIAEVG